VTAHLLFPLAIVCCAAQARLDVPLDVPLGATSPAEPPAVAVEGALRLPGNSGWIELELDVPVTGRYRAALRVAATRPASDAPVVAWVEDHVGNPDGRHYDVTGPIALAGGVEEVSRDGSPLAAGKHRMRLHHAGGEVDVVGLSFTLLRPHAATPATVVQRTEGDTWALVWSDEFDVDGPPDPAKWTHDLGDWGWGNRELQYYTEGRTENARCEGGTLVIEARRGDLGRPWSSARLTTRGKLAFLYGRIELRARVPALDGAWAAGWLLGDAYVDERSWPYCGEIDVVEGVGREVDDTTGDGVNHASCHTRAYYFKQGNHISSTTEVAGMSTEFHVYALEWHRDRIVIELDGAPYYVYDKTDGPLEWPFDQPQNLILNLAMGGGMGGPVATEGTHARFEVDYVRVYGKR
jgi:beta-glucanase (GH16 family)